MTATESGAREVVAATGGLPRCLAFYLPQFHPIQENDAAWGKGFTEWTNVSRAHPIFPGHYQPHLPADLGFYDLRLPEAREAQAALARQYGIDGFVYYHYWFDGHELLQRPMSDVLATGEPRFPFCVAWANENWTRGWDGSEDEIIVGQRYSEADDRKHIRALRTALMDERYIRWDSRPVLLVYRAGLLPDARRTTDIWREEAQAWGLPGLYLLRIEAFQEDCGDPSLLGFDGAVEFQPRRWALAPEHPIVRKVRSVIGHRGPVRHTICSYRQLMESEMARDGADYVRWPGVSPRWDNSPRHTTHGLILIGSTPERYGQWLRSALERSLRVADQAGHPEEPLVFINAWNEWGEGNHLEPDLRYGLSYLEAHRQAIDRFRQARG